MSNPWLLLVIAGLFEVGWPLGLKKGYTDDGVSWPWISFAIVAMGISGWLLLLAQREIPLGTAYAVWTGIGATGTFVLGVLLFNDAFTMMRAFSVLLIVAGVIGLKFG